MNKIVHIGTHKHNGNVFAKIEFADGRLSISGVEGPYPSGNCRGGCGQIVMSMNNGYFDDMTFAPGWSLELARQFVDVWDKWHLNDMRAGCGHQSTWSTIRIDPDELPKNVHANRDENGVLAIWVLEKEHPKGLLCKPCPVCGYKYGTAWLHEDVPQAVIAFLEALPAATLKPAWV